MEAHTATHIIASENNNSIRRTPKLMVGLCNTGNIVSIDWLTESGKAKQALPVENYLILNDKEAEEKYDFEMRARYVNWQPKLNRGALVLLVFI